MSVSLKEVASRAGVSMSTVSRVLSGNERAQIALETQKSVRRAAEDLGYRPNRFARSLITGRTHTIGLLISRLDNPFFVSLIQHAETAAKREGYNVLVDASGTHAEEYAVSGHLSNWPVDGIVMWTWAERKLSDFIGSRAEQTPVVYICERQRSDGAPTITYDIETGARELARYSLARGYQRPAHLVPYGPDDWERPDLRAAVYQQCCQEFGVELTTFILEMKAETREAGFLTGLKIAQLPAESRPDLLFCHNDIVAVGVYHGLLRAGLKVPGDIGISGFDGIAEGRFLDKRLTTVEVCSAEIGQKAIETLLANIAGQPTSSHGAAATHFVSGETV